QQVSPSMATISFHQICITVLSLGLACGIIACASSSWQMSWNARGSGLFDLPNNSEGNSVKALTIIGVAFLAFGLLLEILMIVSNTFKLSKAVNCSASLAGLLIGLIVYAAKFSYGGYSVWLLTASTVFAIEALFFYIIQDFLLLYGLVSCWRCCRCGPSLQRLTCFSIVLATDCLVETNCRAEVVAVEAAEAKAEAALLSQACAARAIDKTSCGSWLNMLDRWSTCDWCIGSQAVRKLGSTVPRKEVSDLYSEIIATETDTNRRRAYSRTHGRPADHAAHQAFQVATTFPSDFLSRQPLPMPPNNVGEQADAIYVATAVRAATPVSISLATMKAASDQDSTVQAALHAIRGNQWDKSDLRPTGTARRAHELSELDGLLLWPQPTKNAGPPTTEGLVAWHASIRGGARGSLHQLPGLHPRNLAENHAAQADRTTGGPLARAGLDFLGPVSGKSLLVCTDHFSRFPLVMPSTDRLRRHQQVLRRADEGNYGQRRRPSQPGLGAMLQQRSASWRIQDARHHRITPLYLRSKRQNNGAASRSRHHAPSVRRWRDRVLSAPEGLSKDVQSGQKTDAFYESSTINCVARLQGDSLLMQRDDVVCRRHATQVRLVVRGADTSVFVASDAMRPSFSQLTAAEIAQDRGSNLCSLGPRMETDNPLIIGSYQLLSVRSRLADCQVWTALHRPTEMEVVMEVYAKTGDDKALIESIVHKMSHFTQLADCKILRLLEAMDLEDAILLVYEHYSSQTLMQYAVNCPVNGTEFRRLVRSLLRTVHRLHSRCFFHGCHLFVQSSLEPSKLDAILSKATDIWS
uniref:GPS domain-containing protein n=1 Tax=Macrostomum lignano TaxID=282301 RepID=A0A1I8F3R7_9PLAT